LRKLVFTPKFWQWKLFFYRLADTFVEITSTQDIRLHTSQTQWTRAIQALKILTDFRILAKLAFVAIVVGVLAVLVDPAQLWSLLANVSLPLFAVVVLLAVCDVVLMGLKWNLLLKAFDVSLGNIDAVLTYLRSRLFAFVAPSTLGVDAYKVYFLTKYYHCAVAPVASSILVERSLGLLAALALASLLLGFSLTAMGVDDFSSFALAGLTLFVGLVFLLHLFIKYSPRLALIPMTVLPHKLARMARLLVTNFSKIESNEARLWVYFLFSMLEKMVYSSGVFVAARAAGFDNIDYLYIVAATPLLSLLEKLPISFSTIGIREGMFVLLFATLDIDATSAVSIALILRCAELSQIALFSFIWLMPCGPQQPPLQSGPASAAGGNSL
jgi:uncharacterized protein (TIRG00374 family)